MSRQTKKPDAVARDIIRRPTTMAAAFADCLTKMGVDVSSAKTPTKREPSWRVSRRAK